MSRHGYSEAIDQKDLAMWRGRVMSAIRGKRGQKLLRDLLTALDAMPVKELVAHDLKNTEGVCALGAVGLARGVAIEGIDPYAHEELGVELNISPCLVAEIEYVNDEYGSTPAQRWSLVRAWAERNIAKAEAPK